MQTSVAQTPAIGQSSPQKHVFAHGMWRTGSTALARCFLDNPGYLVFYEPFHEHCGSARAIVETSKQQETLTSKMRHPDWQGGYFDTLKQTDPHSGKQLWELYDFASASSCVYNAASRQSIAYIKACIRTAKDQNKKAFFGFCRSGFQQASFGASDDIDAFYLYRDPYAQFASFDWPNNDYFMAATLVQLMHSRSLWPKAKQLAEVSWLEKFHLTKRTPKKNFESKLRKARRILARYKAEQIYALFYLSHVATLRQARQLGLSIESTDQFATNPNKRQAFEKQFAVSLETLRPAATLPALDFDTNEVEARVQAFFKS